MLDSARTITLPTDLEWVRGIAPGTLMSAVDPDQPLDASLLTRRDQELAYRDIITMSAAQHLSLRLSTIWSFAAPNIRVPSIVDASFADQAADSNGKPIGGTMVHVVNSSIPLDAITADKGLYDRDTMIYEALARAATLLSNPPITQIDPTLNIDVEWSLAEGAATTAMIDPVQGLTTDNIGDPDKALADRDNTLAAYAAQLANIISNPFEYANRLVIQVTGEDARGAEIYTLLSESATERIWVAEPLLDGRNRVVYHKVNRTMKWSSESERFVHPPQPVEPSISYDGVVGSAPSVRGPQLESQTVTTVMASPTVPDVESLRTKAGRVTPPGVLDTEGETVYVEDSVYNGQRTQDGHMVIIPSNVAYEFTTSGVTPTGKYRVSVEIEPRPQVVIMGDQSLQNGSYTLTNEGITYPSAGGTAEWELRFPHGTWEMIIEYQNVGTQVDPDEYVSVTVFGAFNASASLQYNDAELVQSAPMSFTGDGSIQRFKIQVGAHTGQWHIRRLIFNEVIQTSKLDYNLRAAIADSSNVILSDWQEALVAGRRYRPDVVVFDFDHAPVTSPRLLLGYTDQQGAPFIVRSIQVTQTESVGHVSYDFGLDYWKFEMVQRAMRAFRQSMNVFANQRLVTEYANLGAAAFDDRAEIQFVTTAQVYANTDLASREANEDWHAGNPGGKSVWWKWTAKATGTLTLDVTDSNFTALVAIYTGTAVDSLTEVASSGTGSVTASVTAGTEYAIVVDGADAASGNAILRLTMNAPSNTELVNAQLGGFYRLFECDTTAAYKETGEANHAGDAGGKSVWFKFPAPYTGRSKIDVTGTSFSPVIHAYTINPSAHSATVAEGVTYHVFDSSVQYNGVWYPPGSTFVGVSGLTVYGIMTGPSAVVVAESDLTHANLVSLSSVVGTSLEWDLISGKTLMIAVDGVSGAGGTLKVQIQPEFRTLDGGTYYWDNDARERLNIALSIDQTNIFTAFKYAGPNDVGRPCIVPSGLQYDYTTGRVVATHDPDRMRVELITLQPWMLKFKPLVVRREFVLAESDAPV